MEYFVLSIYFITFANVFQKGIVPQNKQIKTTFRIMKENLMTKEEFAEFNSEMNRLKNIKWKSYTATLKGHEFSVRINGTSDLNPTLFKLGKKNILQMFPNVMFYDYTKVPNYMDLLKQYPNYDITWSIDGSKDNFKLGMDYLKEGGRIAVVFGTETMPNTFMGYNVIDGDKYDARYKDGNVVVGLKFKRTAENFKNGKFVMPNTEFIVKEGDVRCKW